MNTKTAAMRAARRSSSSTKHQSVRTTIERSVALAQPTSAAGIARAAGVSETILATKSRPATYAGQYMEAGL